MKCPFCDKSVNHVLESRVVEEGGALRRRRVCESCGKRFTTYERAKNHAVWVVKKDGKREPFNRDKLKRGILRAIEKRPVSVDAVEEIASKVEREMLKRKREEVTSSSIGKSVLRKLRSLDKVAWLRFASVYLEFEEIEDFEEAISKLLKSN